MKGQSRLIIRNIMIYSILIMKLEIPFIISLKLCLHHDASAKRPTQEHRDVIYLRNYV